jgi:hypothetical protein
VSLINEALRKARQAASEKEAQPPDGAFRPAKAYPSRRSGGRGGFLAVALVAVAAAAVGAAAAWWFFGQSQTAPVEAVIIEAPSHDPEAPLVAPVASPTPVDARTEVYSRETLPAPTPEVADVVDRDETIRADTGPAPGETGADDRAADSAGDRVFVMEADVGYASLSLGFIVARSADPFAEINGVEISIGSEIEGFVVEAIEADRVILRDDKGPLVLRVP